MESNHRPPACEEIWMSRFRPNLQRIGVTACLNPAYPLSAAIKPMSSYTVALTVFREPQCVAIWVIDVELAGSPRLISRSEMDWTLTVRWL